jgi:phytoene dehydrogenase-like protein
VKSMVIIGAGVAGLSTGCYAQMNGYDSVILEMRTLPGGVCTSWKRGDFLFDHCLHWVLGSNKGSSLYPIFEELGIASSVQFFHTDRFRRIESKGRSLVVYTDLSKLEKEIIRLFPDEERAARKFIRLVRFYTRFRPPLDADFGSFGLSAILKMLPYVPSFLRLTRVSIERFLKLFRNPDLRDMLFQMFPVRGMPALMAVMPLAYFHNQEGGYPLGGSLHFARALEKRYAELGGTIRYGHRVRKIAIENGAAVGVQTEDGEEVAGDIVVSACDGRTTLFEMLEGKYLTREIERFYQEPSLWPPIISISLGVNRDLSAEVDINCFKLDRPVTVGDHKVEWLSYFHYCHDLAFAPAGKSVVKMQIETDYDHWRSIYADPRTYQAEKQRVLQVCLGELERRLPGITGQVEVTDVATPVTWERYTGNWRGSYEGWLPKVGLFGKLLPRELPGLRDFYMTGQWTFPGGGVPMCMSQARRLVKHLCEEQGREFVTTTPST